VSSSHSRATWKDRDPRAIGSPHTDLSLGLTGAGDDRLTCDDPAVMQIIAIIRETVSESNSLAGVSLFAAGGRSIKVQMDRPKAAGDFRRK
jgi:hypothetical protein